MATSLSRRQTVLAGLVAGIVGGLLSDAFLFTVPWISAPYPPPAQAYTDWASILFGSVATGASWAIPAGIAFRLASAVAWAYAYLWASRSQPQLLTRPIVSGLAFGVVVWFMTQMMLLPIGKFVFPNQHTFDRDMVAYMVFYGLPVAVIASRMVRRG
jgi:hypothetical protein